MWRSSGLNKKYNERGREGGDGTRSYLLWSAHCVHSWSPPSPGRATCPCCPCCCCSTSPCCPSSPSPSGLGKTSRSWPDWAPGAWRRGDWASSLTCWPDCGLCSEHCEDCGGSQERETGCRSSWLICPGARETSGPGEAASSPWASGRQPGT